MSGHGSGAWRVAVLGFTTFERDTLEAYFRIAAKRSAWVRTAPFEWVRDAAEAALLLVDADQPGVVRGMADGGRLGDCLLIGGRTAPAGPAAWLPRPVDVMQVARRLEQIRQQRLRRRLARPSAWARQQAPADGSVHRFGSVAGYSNAVMGGPECRLANVLLVSNDEFEWRPLRGQLLRLGYEVELATSSTAALKAARQRHWPFIFLGAQLSEPGPFETCRELKAEGSGKAKPVVVVLSAEGRPIDRVRATFSGADACLSRAGWAESLMPLLSRHDSTFERVFEPTAPLPR